MKFPTTFCISLKSAVKRRETVSNHLKSHGIDFHLFDAINGPRMGLDTRLSYLDDHPNWKPEDGPTYRIGQGVLGCAMSHYTVWRIMEYLNDDYFFVVEDDVELCEGFKEKLMATIQNLPSDWQFVFVGHCCLDPKMVMVREGIANTPHPPMCNHAYMVRKTAVKHLIETNELMYAPIDIQLQKRTLPTISHYSLVPPLAIQNGQPSTIHG
jgi:GR25 family glycosyltransferase involved in LPS biosynthesis